MTQRKDGTTKNRRTPLPDVARQLFVFSGNECAWGDPNCTTRLVTAEDGWVGEIAHIIGAEPTSARHEEWDGKDVDDLRHFSNLILLCKVHARNIDDKNSRGEFTVEHLRAVKERHEAPYRYGLEQLEAEFRDAVAGNLVIPATTMRRYFRWEGVDLEPAEEAEVLALISKLADRVCTLTRQARQVLALVIKEDEPNCQLIERRLTADSTTLISICEELARIEAAELYVDQWGEDLPRVLLRGGAVSEIPEMWGQLRMFAESEGIDLNDIFVNLDFSLLD
ncbi:hypothetical protein [Streptomyces albidoflavus]|uniref:hypothetical protein n=1 Tax=Streptomyces albidoflavus TaxID=1886 RepID=UPI00101E542B|nr:hypothetical protein [Streptomyces albidoflavus]RZD84765.1 hypothetical protein C0Q63_17495 [Streptomyces albidoflavus]